MLWTSVKVLRNETLFIVDEAITNSKPHQL